MKKKREQKNSFIKKKEAEARKISIKEGSIATIQTGLGDTYIAPYALALNASNFEISMLSSIPSLLGPLSQKFGSRLIEKYSRKKVLLIAVLFQALIWLPIISLAFLQWKGILTSSLSILLVIFFSVYAIFGNLGGPAWFSWMGDIVNERKRGKFFSLRNRITGAIALLCTLGSSFLLDFFKQNNFVLFGFSIFFFIAMTARLISRELLKKQYEPKLELEKGYYFSFWQFMKKAPKNNFGKFSIYVALIKMAASIAGPFFVVYMLRDLGFSYVTFILVFISEAVGGLIMMPILGKFSDKHGNYKLMSITSIVIALFPALWLLSESPFYLALVPQLIVGIAWAGFNLAAGNFIYDSVTPQKRGLAVSYYNILGGIGIFLGATIGGIIAKYVHINFMNIILFIFLISAVARALVNLIMLPKIGEIRKVKKFNSARALKNLVLKTIRIPIIPHQAMFEFFAKKRFKESSPK